MTIAALFVETGGAYFGLDGVDPWDEQRDARKYNGEYHVVAHPPCFLWVNLAAVNWKRYRREKPAWYPGGTDEGCFESALASVRRCGGVLEHPAFTHAWQHFGLTRPELGKWKRCTLAGAWVTEVWQSAYGHKARKRTWLYYRGANPPLPLVWSTQPGTHQIGWFDRNKPTLTKKEASRTPPMFRSALIALAATANPEVS